MSILQTRPGVQHDDNEPYKCLKNFMQVIVKNSYVKTYNNGIFTTSYHRGQDLIRHNCSEVKSRQFYLQSENNYSKLETKDIVAREKNVGPCMI